jgi:putative ABC transport system permease protein
MKYLPLIWAGLWRKRARTALTLCSIAIAFVLIGLLAGVDAAFAHQLAVSRLDRLLVTSQTNMPISYADQIARVQGVALVAPVNGVYGYYQNAKQRVGVNASDERLFAFLPEITITRDQLRTLRQLRTGAVVSGFLADKYGWKVGDKIPIYANNTSHTDGSHIWTFEIVAMVSDTALPDRQWFIGNYEYVDEGRAADRGTADVFLVRINDPTRSSEISFQIDHLFENSAVPTLTSSDRSRTESQLQTFGDAKFLTRAVVVAVLFMLLFITGSTITQSIRERIPEFAMLKTVGFSDGSVVAFVIAETALLCAFAAVIGLLLSKLLISLVHEPPYTFLLFQTSWASMASAFALSLAIALASALLPARRVQRLSIVDALAGR